VQLRVLHVRGTFLLMDFFPKIEIGALSPARKQHFFSLCGIRQLSSQGIEGSSSVLGINDASRGCYVFTSINI